MGVNTTLHSRQRSLLFGTTQMYSTIIQAVAASVPDPPAKDKLYHDFRIFVGAIVCIAEPLSRLALAALLDVPSSDVRVLLQPLHALLHVPPQEDAPVRPLHLSFAQYLTGSKAHHQPYGVHAPTTHAMLWYQCLRLLSSPHGLRANICELSHPGQLRSEIAASTISKHLPPPVQYACRYWVYHVQSSSALLHDQDEVHTFLQDHFLHWLEALSLLSRLADAIELISVLLAHVAVSPFSYLTVSDATY